MNKDTYKDALKRNLSELVIAKLEFEAYREIGDKLVLGSFDSFFTLAQIALFNDMVAHMIKVLDRNAQSATFWYIYNCKLKEVEKFIKENNINYMAIYGLAEKLKIVRDKTHFHIDREGVRDPKAIWADADITYKELEENINSIYNILNYLHIKEFDFEFEIPQIDDLQYIIEASVEAGYAIKRED